MALRKQKLEAIRMRKAGASYSQIKERLHVSKSSLSLWLRDMPLPEKRLRELRDWNAVRIERFQRTMRRKREVRRDGVRVRAAKDIETLNKRELLIAGLFLYWGEGTKTSEASTSISNTDPMMIRFFITWLESLGVDRSDLRVYVHLYSNMNISRELRYWSKTLELPLSSFRKPYIKTSTQGDLSYPQRFGHGTCNLIYGDRDVAEYVMAALEHIRMQFAVQGGV